MPRRRNLRPVPALDEAALSKFLEAQGSKVAPHCARIIAHVVSRGPQCQLDDVAGLPAWLPSVLRSAFTPCSSSIQGASHSRDGLTTKLLIRLQDGMAVEAVIMRHDPSAGRYGGGARGGGVRVTLCLSSQVGCQMGCSFCATGAMGLKGNLSAGEILEQLLLAQDFLLRSRPRSPPCSTPSAASEDAWGSPSTPCGGHGAHLPAAEAQPRPALDGSTPADAHSLPHSADAGVEAEAKTAAERRAGAEAAAEAGAGAGEEGVFQEWDEGQQLQEQGGRGSPGPGRASWHAPAAGPSCIRNVVFMGMGEPLNNYEAVKRAVATMTAPHGFHLSPHHITVSTVGVVPRLLSFAQDMPVQVNLALSLHAPTQELRQTIVPSARAYPLPALMAALDKYQQQSGKRVFVEYVLLEGVNDSLEVAHQLGSLLRTRDLVVNLIPYNPITPKEAVGSGAPAGAGAAATYSAPSHAAAVMFQRVLREQYGLRSTVRREMGQDIAGACGQLATSPSPPQGSSSAGLAPEGAGDRVQEPSRSPASAARRASPACSTAPRDIEDLLPQALPGTGARVRRAVKEEPVLA